MAESNALVKKNDYNTENKLILKEKEINDKIAAKKDNEINTWSNKCRYDKLTHYFEIEDRIPVSFNDFNHSLVLKRKIIDGSADLEKANKKSKKI